MRERREDEVWKRERREEEKKKKSRSVNEDIELVKLGIMTYYDR